MYIDKLTVLKRDSPPDPSDDDWSVFFYNPSLPAAIIFAILYLISFFYHLYISYKAYVGKTNYFRFSYSIPLLLAALIEVNGYGQRAGSTQSVQDIGLFATSQTMIVLAPVLVCASLYILLARIIVLVPSDTHSHSSETGTEKEARILSGWVKVTWLPKILITLDIAAMLTQGGGSAIAASGQWEGQLEDIGTGVLIAGLALQVATFSVFLIVVARFHLAAYRKMTHEGMATVLTGVYISGFFIMVRSIFRLIEFAWGTESYIMTHEWPTYVLEGVPMFIAFMVLGWCHPSRWLPASIAGESRARGWTNRH